MLWQHIHESTIKNKYKIGEESIQSFNFSLTINNTLWQYFIRCNLETGLSFFFFKLTCDKWTLLLPWCAKHKIKNEKKSENNIFIFFCVRTFRNKNMNSSDLLSGFYYTFYRFIFFMRLRGFLPQFFWLKELHQLQTSYLMADLQEIHTFIKADGYFA